MKLSSLGLFILFTLLIYSHVQATGAFNSSPVARIETRKLIILPENSVSLDGSSSTDSDGTIVGYEWTKLSGPTQGTISNATSVIAKALALVAGTYVFHLIVTDDGGAHGTKDVTIVVKPTSSKMLVEWKNVTIPVDGLPDGTQWATDRLRSSIAYNPLGLTRSADKLKIVVDSKVPVNPAVSSAKYHYRSEFTDFPWEIQLPESTEQWFGWSYFFTADYVWAVSPISIFQNHAAGSSGTPTFQLELTKPGQFSSALGGELQVINNVATPAVRKLTTIRPKPGERMDVICHVVYARDPKGLLEFWINGNKIYSQSGNTIYPSPENWGGNNKWGIYHHTWTDPAKVELNIAAGHTKFELLMGNLRQITRSSIDPKYLSDSKAEVDPAQDYLITAIEPVEPNGLTVYPSPVKRGEHLTIKDSDAQNFEVVLIDCTGHQIKKITVTESAIIATDDMPVGLYILLKQNNNRNEVVKIMVVD